MDDNNSIQMHVHSIEDKDKFRLFIQYRGKCSEHYARALHKIQAPCRVIMTLRKLKTVLPSLKPPIDWDFRSDVIYQIECLRCQAGYVGQTDQHVITRFKHHQHRNAPVSNHFAGCNVVLDRYHIKIIAATTKSISHLKGGLIH